MQTSAHCGSHSHSVSNAASHGPVTCGVAGVFAGFSVFIIDLTFLGVDVHTEVPGKESLPRHSGLRDSPEQTLTSWRLSQQGDSRSRRRSTGPSPWASTSA